MCRLLMKIHSRLCGSYPFICAVTPIQQWYSRSTAHDVKLRRLQHDLAHIPQIEKLKGKVLSFHPVKLVIDSSF